jgi:hypothetical protein
LTTKKPVLTTQQQAAFNTALTTGIERDNMDMIRTAISQGADAAILLPAGIERKNMDMITLALDNGADPNILLFEGIHFKATFGSRLKYQFAEFDQHDPNRPKPAHFGLDFVTTAVKYGADVNATQNDEDGAAYPAIHWAYKNFREEVTDFLIEKGASVDTPTKNNNTPLMRAVLDGEPDLVEYYLGKGADPLRPCGKKSDTFPLQALEEGDKFWKGTKANLIQLMMERAKPAGADATPAADFKKAAEPAVGTSEDIEVSHPLELKAPEPKPGKSFTL